MKMPNPKAVFTAMVTVLSSVASAKGRGFTRYAMDGTRLYRDMAAKTYAVAATETRRSCARFALTHIEAKFDSNGEI